MAIISMNNANHSNMVMEMVMEGGIFNDFSFNLRMFGVCFC